MRDQTKDQLLQNKNHIGTIYIMPNDSGLKFYPRSKYLGGI